MTFRPELIISGGQTGADIGGLIAAQKAGIATGGWAPLGYKTERGPQPDVLAGRFGLKEHPSPDYPPRTRQNVEDSDATVIFSFTPRSQGSFLTSQACDQSGKPYILIRPDSEFALPDLSGFLERTQPKILNVAGNRESSADGIAAMVRDLGVPGANKLKLLLAEAGNGTMEPESGGSRCPQTKLSNRKSTRSVTN